MKRNKWMSVAAGVWLTLSLTACGGDGHRETQKYDDAHSGPADFRTLQSPNHDVDTHHNTKMQVSRQMARRIAAMPEVRSANVLVTDQNVYVAVVLDEKEQKKGMNAKADITSRNSETSRYDDVADEIKQRISKQVTAMTPGMKNIYVSANPDFVSRVNRISEEAGKGHAIQAFVEEFNAMAERMFPATTP
ncbi:hypothetical protein SY83_06990 [Paenibacillus swuensis]|uniref:Sporulation protein n=1 Tax=Paenibacillus swuensis TaxID=1178515 RepID=A0A172TGD1_9BACL|nr:YhcN/YlaJ family sporulation lipoprotein [Paenibacillus swuensis]ANE46070.1 hypothetical protein SY83_06990 [Paenibacillus swuensis]